MAVPWFHTPTLPLIRRHSPLGTWQRVLHPGPFRVRGHHFWCMGRLPTQKLPPHALRIESLTLEDPFAASGPVPITIQEVRNGDRSSTHRMIRAGTAANHHPPSY